MPNHPVTYKPYHRKENDRDLSSFSRYLFKMKRLRY